MKISKEKYDYINSKLENFEYNLNVISVTVGDKKLTQDGANLRNAAYLAGYLDALQDLEVDFFARLDGEVTLDPSCVED